MINRVLIRRLVVQMVFSYMLSQNEFKIDSAPETNSRDQKYAYKIYVNFLLLILELSGYSVYVDGKKPHLFINNKLEGNEAAKSLSKNEDVRAIINKGNHNVEIFDGILQTLEAKIVASKIFVDYSKKKEKDISDDILLWTTLLKTLFLKDPEINQLLRAQGDYSGRGLELGVDELCNTLNSYAMTREIYSKARKDLDASLKKAYELYLWFFQLIIDITNEQERRIEAAKSKYLPTPEDLNPNTRLIDNKLVAYLKNDEELSRTLKDNKIMPCDFDDYLVKELLNIILSSKLYEEYITNDDTTLFSETEFWREAFRSLILQSDVLNEYLEDKSLFWNDDAEIIGSFFIKTLRQIAVSHGEPVKLLPEFKDDEDKKFGPELFLLTIHNKDKYSEYTAKFLKSSWDIDRIPIMDKVIIITAMAEIINYPSVPLAASINEYVDIANCYSTPKSGAFIHGLLYNASKYFNSEGIIHKS